MTLLAEAPRAATMDGDFPALAMPIAEIAGRWWVARVRRDQGAGGERRACCDLARAGLAVYCPVDFYLVMRGSSRRRVPRVLFPSYIFVASESPEMLSDARDRDRLEHNRVIAWISVLDQNQLVSELSSLELALGSGVHLLARNDLKPDLRVRVTGGPLMGVEGRINKVYPHVVHLSVTMLGQSVQVEVSPDLLEAA